jgi:RNA polymerase sigma-70 factor, ECF subfamily
LEHVLKGFQALETPVDEIASKAIRIPFVERAPSVGTAVAERSLRAQLTLEDVYVEHVDTVTRWVVRLGGPHFDSADAVQDVFAVVAEKLSTFRGESKLTTWLYGITENVVHQQLRRDRLRRWVFGGGRGVGLPAPELQPAEAERLQSTDLVYRALDRLREPYRSTIILFEIDGLSGQQIAELKGCKLATVWVWLHRARAQFLKQLNKLAER